MIRFGTTLVVLLLGFSPAIASETRKPNIVIFLADDLGYADLGCQGCKDIPTPNIDSLAKNGIRCTNGYANHPVCSPSRAALLSGRYQQRFGFEYNSGPERFASPLFGLPRDEMTLAERLKAVGYATGMVGKWHVGFKEGLRPHERGFDFHFGFLSGAHTYLPDRKDNDPLLRNGKVVQEKEYLTDAFAREAVAFIDRSKDKPFFLYVAFNAVHAPLQATSAYEKRFPAIKDAKRKTYAGMLAAMDDAVGKILAKLRELKLEQDTLVAFYSDNGGPTAQTTSRNDPLRGFKGQMYEGGIRVPFLLQWKGRLPAGIVYEPMVAGFDLHATALAAAGVPLPKEKPLDGVDLVPYLKGEKKGQPRETLFWRAGAQHAARVGDWKLVSVRGDAQLFNLKDDIGEKTDLSAKRPEKLKELQAAYAAWDKQMIAPKWIRQDAKKPGTKKEQPKADDTIATRFKQLDANGDGKLSAEELKKATPAVQRRLQGADKDKDGMLTLEEVRAHLAPPAPKKEEPMPKKPGEPALKPGPDNDAGKDAEGRGQLFESIHVVGLTDIRKGMNGFAVADLNHDGLPDLVAVFTPPIARPEDPAKTGNVERLPLRQASDQLLILINEGGFKFRSHTIEIRGSTLTNDKFGQRTQIPNLADFNGDGHLDILITRSAAMLAGKMRASAKDGGNTLLVSDGAWDKFRDLSDKLGIRNETGYNRQSSIADVNRDGWLDIAIGCDNIGNAMGGLPYSRLYVFKPNGPKFEDGKFEDIGGTDLVPDFGGFYHDPAKDKAGPGITLRDLDGDGDLDLIQLFHVDVREPLLPYSPGEYRQGLFCWKNLLVETGKLKFEKVTGNGFAAETRLKYNREKQFYEPASDTTAPGLPYISVADVDNDGKPDLFAVGPSDRSWSPRVEYVGGRFWKNLGRLQFEERTKLAGLEAINNTYRQWYAFFDCPLSTFHKTWKPRVDKLSSQPGLKPTNPIDNRPYYADAVFGDFNNDGWQDVIVLDRRESPVLVVRSILFLNKGDGTFEPKPTTFSGLDAGGISGEAADLNGDGLLDLVVASDPDNSGVAMDIARYESKVYWNTGEHGAKANHWLRLRFAGLRDAELIGAKVELIAGGQKQHRWIHSNHTYKSGGALDAHFGLGKHEKADVVVTLPRGKSIRFANLAVDRVLTLDLATQQLTTVSAQDRTSPTRPEVPTLGNAKGKQPRLGAYRETSHKLKVDNREREYIVQAPTTLKGPLPVVFFFHGGGGRGENMAVRGFREMVARENFLAVYPTGWKNNWNDGRNAARIASQQEGVDDVKFVRAIVEDLAKRHKIDRGRIFASGVSNGGIFSHYLAAHAADLFAAVAPVIGGLAEPVAPKFKPSEPISLLVIQGDADPLVPIGGGPIARSDRGGRIIATEDMLRLYVKHNGITGKPTEETLPDKDPNDGCRTIIRRYPTGIGGVKVEYWLIQGGGHTMPGRPAPFALKEALVGKTSRDFDGLEVIWKFFQSCPARKHNAQGK